MIIIKKFIRGTILTLKLGAYAIVPAILAYSVYQEPQFAKGLAIVLVGILIIAAIGCLLFALLMAMTYWIEDLIKWANTDETNEERN